jgi:uncharacterized membrane protein YhaH (DUF805 family)
MSSPPPGYDPNDPQGSQPGWGAPQPSGYGPAPAYSGGDAPAPQMGFADAVRTVLSKYATFDGRARRSEFWWFYLASFLASVVAAIIDAAIGSDVGAGTGVVGLLLSLALLIPGLAVGARRLHDTGRSGWWQLIALVPLVGIILLIVWWATDGHRSPNQHGPSPKYQAVGGY